MVKENNIRDKVDEGSDALEMAPVPVVPGPTEAEGGLQMHAKRLTLLLALGFVGMLSLAACGAAEQQPATSRPAPSPPSTPTAAAAAAPTTAPTAAPSPATAPPPGPRTVARERTFIVMQGGADGRNPDYDNFNLFVPGSNNGWHSGPLQTMNEPLVMFNVLTGEHENWLA